MQQLFSIIKNHYICAIKMAHCHYNNIKIQALWHRQQ